MQRINQKPEKTMGSKKLVNEFQVLKNTALNDTNFCIQLKSPVSLPEIFPGQFVNIEIEGSSEVFLRRPFSVFEVDYQNNTLSLLVKILGRGSKKLTEIAEGDSLNLVFPLGNGFTLPEKNDKILLIGGGSGVAPILFLAKLCGLQPENVDVLIGARTSNDHIDASDYKNYASLHYTTEDGSLETKGFVTQHTVFTDKIADYNKIYTCGPNPMMKAIAKVAAANNIWCEVSLENLMACGFGVCLCCIEPTNKGNLCVCTDGPVFNINSLKW